MNPDPRLPGPRDLSSVGRFLVFTLAILLDALLSHLGFGFGYAIMNLGADRESFNLLAAMMSIGVAILGPLVSLYWIAFANSKSPSFRWGTLYIPLLFVPCIAAGLGMISGVILPPF